MSKGGTLSKACQPASPVRMLAIMSIDFVIGLALDAVGNTSIVVFIDQMSKMAHLAVVSDSFDRVGTAQFIRDRGFCQHGLPNVIVSDRDPPLYGYILDFGPRH